MPARSMQPPQPYPLEGSKGMALSRAMYEMLAQQFRHSGWSNHSSQGSTAWVGIEVCRKDKVPFRVVAAESASGHRVGVMVYRSDRPELAPKDGGGLTFRTLLEETPGAEEHEAEPLEPSM